MTRIIKKSKKRRDEEEIREEAPVDEGKDLSQAGNWFQKNKTAVTWALVIAFALTCIGLTSLTNCAAPKDDVVTQLDSQGKETKVSAVEKEIAARKDAAERTSDPEGLLGLALAYRAGVLTLSADDFENRNSNNEAKIKEYSAKYRETLGKALESLTPENPSYDSTLTYVCDVCVEDGDYDKAIRMALTNSKVKTLSETAPENVPQIGASMVKGGTSPDGIEIDDTTFVPILSSYVMAMIGKGEYKKVSALADFAMKYNPMNSALYAECANAQLKAGELSKADDTVKKAAAIAYSFASSGQPDSMAIYDAARKIVLVAEVQGDVLMAQGKKEDAANAYDSALFYLGAVSPERSAAIKEKRKATGVPERPRVVNQQQMPDGSLKFIMSDGSEVVVPVKKPDSGKDGGPVTDKGKAAPAKDSKPDAAPAKDSKPEAGSDAAPADGAATK